MNVRLHAVPPERPKVIGYVRVSTAREEMISPELQRAAIEDHCARRGYELTDVIEDLDATGRNFTRKGVQRAIELVEAAGVAVVVVWKFSRFGRDRKGWAINLDRVESAGGRLESATEDVDATTSTGRFTRGMLSEIAAWESERIGEQWKEAHERRIKHGMPHDGRERFGYRYHRRTSAMISCAQGCGLGECEPGYVIDPETAPYVAEIFDRYNRGESVRTIAIWLNSRAVRTTLGNTWSARTVRRYMDTGFPVGRLRVHSTTCRCKTPQTCDNVTYPPAAHQAIIDEATWETYRRNRKRRRKLPPRVEAAVYPLSGLVFCSKCHGPMNAHGMVRKGKNVPGYIYRCAQYQRARLCDGTWIVRARLEGRVLDWVGKVAAAEVNERAALTTARRTARTTVAADRKRLLRQAQKLAEALTRLTLDRAKGLVPEAAYATARDEIQAEQDTVERALEQLADEAGKLREPPVPVARDLMSRWHTLPAQTRRDLLAKLVSRLTVTSIRQGVSDVVLLTTWGEEVKI